MKKILVILTVFLFFVCGCTFTYKADKSSNDSLVQAEKFMKKEIDESLPVIDKFLELYNQGDFLALYNDEIIDERFRANDTEEKFVSSFNNINDMFGEFIVYNLENSEIHIRKVNNGFNEYLFVLPAEFDKKEKCKLTIRLVSEKNSPLKIIYTNFYYEIN